MCVLAVRVRHETTVGCCWGGFEELARKASCGERSAQGVSSKRWTLGEDTNQPPTISIADFFNAST